MSRTLADQPQLPRLLAARQKKRRGIILLMVVSLLALFLLMGVTFAILAIQYNFAASTAAQRQRYGDPVHNEADMVLNQMLYESLTPTSLSGHGLLRDMYGNDYLQYPPDFNTGITDNQFTIQVLTNTNQGGGQLLQITFDSSQVTAPATGSASLVPGYYNGRVLTIYSATIGQWVSTRVVQYVAPSTGNTTARIYAENPVGDYAVQPFGNTSNSTITPFVVNGLPFNGAGIGFDPTMNPTIANNMNALEKDFRLPVALLPHYWAYETKSGYNVNDASNSNGFLLDVGGADEPWDAADYQTMFLGFVPPRVVIDTLNNPLIPSYHRPEVLHFWMNNAANTGNRTPADPNTIPGKNLLRRMILRPMPWDDEHPRFTGGNSNFDRNRFTSQQILASAAQQGGWSAIWDVDNDGDGIADSIWIDPGLPVMTHPNGRRYKRLAAILVKDLDSRANANVHGNNYLYSNSQNRAETALTLSATSAPPFMLAGYPASGTVTLPRGFGFGPAEVDFCNILGGHSNATASQAYNYILSGNPTTGVIGRYGSDGAPGQLNIDDVVSRFKQLPLPSNGDHTAELSLYSTPPDVWGRGAVAMDYFGQPAWNNMGTYEISDDPYEMQFDPHTAINDAPFTAMDQEALMRYLDTNAPAAQSRFMNLAQSVLATTPPGQLNTQEHIRRESLTMLSQHVPGPRSFWRNDNRPMQPVTSNGITRMRQGISVLDLYYQRLQGASNFNQAWRTIVPFELMHGEAFNINRLFGNGQQNSTTVDNLAANNPRAIFDDPSESVYGTEQITAPNGTNYNVEHHNDDPNRPISPAETPPPQEYFPLNARITYARHLYCLLMLIKNNNVLPTGGNINLDLDGDGTPGTPRDTARYLAQIAVNVVDFRDSDSINTGFEYDAQPFDASGWDVDGYLSTPDSAAGINRGVVWGVERPEVLLTESLALHARRTQDTPIGAPGTQETTVDETDPNKMKDNDYDQRLRPKGSAFIELFNPWVDRTNNVYDHKPGELYFQSTRGNFGVKLDATTGYNRNPTGPQIGAAHPVWRILIVRNPANGIAPDPDSPVPEAIATSNPASIDRTVYFTNPSALPPGWTNDTTDRRFYPGIATPGTNTLSILMPGCYAIVGSGGILRTNDYTTIVGREQISTPTDSTLNWNATRRLVLRPGTDETVNQFQVLGNKTPDLNPGDYRPTIAFPLDMPRNFSVSEPIGGYEGMLGAAVDASVWTATGTPDEPTTLGVALGAYSPAIDTPLDKYRRDNPSATDPQEAADAILLMQNATSTAYRTLYLQRLANPTVPWHRQINPYITIDTASMDITAFNGLVNDATDPEKAPVPARRTNLQTFQRGGSDPAWTAANFGFLPAPPATQRNLWAIEPLHTGAGPVDSPDATNNPHHFNKELFHTLGFINSRYGPAFNTTTVPAPHNAYTGAPSVTAAGTSTFPWLVHANRPFMSPIELLHVSCKSQSQLLQGYTVNGLPTNGYVSAQVADPLFSHLANYLQTNSVPGTIGALDGPLLARIMDYIETPAPFVGSERYYNVANFSSSASPGGNVPTSTYRPPFGKLSRFRDPGRINLNSMSEFEIWNSLVDSYPTWGATAINPANAYNIFLSRQGYNNPGASGAAWGEMSPTYPTIFANPFRPAEAADLMPVVLNSSGTTIVDMRRREADATLLRGHVNGGVDVNRPLFSAPATAGQLAHTDPARSPFFRYQPLQKIANNVSYNSNCFATWITIGYFEVEENQGGADVAHPDGFRLGQELGIDEGNTQRHRSFYLIDRSIPVGFVPGFKLNSEDCVLLKRQID